MSKVAPPGVSIGPDGVARCWWGDSDDLRRYHDTEWGRPVADDRRLFEKLSLEGFMSGLSWLTILRKRENFRAAFHGFDPSAIARFTTRDVARLMGDEGIVRNRAKIEATINNARRLGDLVDEFNRADDYVTAITRLYGMVKGIEHQGTIVEGDEVAVFYILDTPVAKAPVAEWYTVRSGKITQLRAYFDARPFAGAGR